MDGYNIYNLNDFDKLSVPQVYGSANLEDLGNMPYCITKGQYYGVIFNGEYLVPELNGQNPYVGKHSAVFIDEDRNLWVGVKDES